MQLKVECYAGYKGEETPRCLVLDGKRIEVTEVVDRWLAPDHGYFKLRGADGALYIVRHDARRGLWELVMFDRGSPPRPL